MTPRKPASAPPEGLSTDLASLSQNDATILAEIFRLLDDPSWFKAMLCCVKGPTPVSDVTEAVELSQLLVSRHPRLLHGVRLVKGARQSK